MVTYLTSRELEVDPGRRQETRGGLLRGVQVDGSLGGVKVHHVLPAVQVCGRAFGGVQVHPAGPRAASSLDFGRVPLAELRAGRAAVRSALSRIGWWSWCSVHVMCGCGMETQQCSGSGSRAGRRGPIDDGDVSVG